VVIPVDATMFEADTLVVNKLANVPVPALKAAVEILVVANNVPVVSPVLKINDVPLAFVNVKLVAVAPATCKLAVEILVVANKVPVVNPVLKIIFDVDIAVATRLVTVWLVALSIPVEILVVASKVLVVNPVDKTNVLAETLVALKVEVVILAVPRLAVEMLVEASKEPAVIPPLTVKVPILAVVMVAFVAPREGAVKLVVAIRVPVVKLGTCNVVAVTLVNTALVTVILVAAKLADETKVEATREDVVTPVVNRALPFTSNVYAGAVVEIPTLPPVVNIDPTVLLFPIADKLLEINTDPADIFVSTKFVVVILTTVKVPPMFKLPDK
jgi:hypothetical protein